MARLSPRLSGWLAGILLAVHAILAWLARAPGIETARDDAMYLQLARSLLHFSYREVWRPDAPLHLQYPPGYPLLLALTSAIFGEHFDLFVALNVAASAATLFIAWRVVARRWSPELGLLVLLALAPNPQLLERAGQIASEPLYMLLSIAAVAVLARADVRPRDRALAAVLAIAAALTRSVGTSLVIAVGLLWLIERRWKLVAAYGAATLLTLGAWLLWTVREAPRAAGESYVGDALSFTQHGKAPLLAWIESIGAHFATYAAATVPEVLAVPTMPGTIVDNIVGAGIVALCSLIGVLLLWERWRSGAVYLACAFALLLSWPWGPLRFVAPLLPLIATVVLAGAEWLLARARPAWALAAPAAIALVLAITGLSKDATLLAQRADCARGSWPPARGCVVVDRSSFYEAAMWIRAHLPPDAVVVTAKNETLAYYADRRTLPIRVAMSRDSSLPVDMRRAGTPWLLLSSLHWNELGPLRQRLAEQCRYLAVAQTFPPRTVLFRISETALPDEEGCRAMADYYKANLGHDLDRGP